MKKLMVALVAVAMAGLASAATCTWGSGALKTASSKDGGWSAVGVNAASAEVTMSLYKITAEEYATLSTASQADLYEAYSSQTADLSGVNKNASSGAYIGAITINETAATAVEGQDYAVVLLTYKDATYGDMYMAKAVTTTWNSSTKKGSVGNIGSGIANWQAASVPEPTSGLLLLLGMAGLALRRRHA